MFDSPMVLLDVVAEPPPARTDSPSPRLLRRVFHLLGSWKAFESCSQLVALSERVSAKSHVPRWERRASQARNATKAIVDLLPRSMTQHGDVRRPSPLGRCPATRPALSEPLSVLPDTACGLFLAGSRGWAPSRRAGFCRHPLRVASRRREAAGWRPSMVVLRAHRAG